MVLAKYSIKGHLLLFLVGALFCTHCQEKERQIAYLNPDLNSKILAYTDSETGRKDKRKVLTIYCFSVGDTVKFEISNTFPDSTEASIIGYNEQSAFTLFFIGDKRDDYFKLKTNSSEAKIKLRNLILAKYGPGPMPGLNFKTYYYRFINDKIIE